MRKGTQEGSGGKPGGQLWHWLERMVREKVQEFIQEILEDEVTQFLGGREKSQRRASVGGAPKGYRNGYGKPRTLTLASGTIEVRRPRVRDVEERFESRVLPLFARRTREAEELVVQLYLHGLAEGDFELALRGLLGEGAPLSKSTVRRLRERWVTEHAEWEGRSLAGREVVYVWADGICVKAGLEKDKAALLVVTGAMADGTKEVLAVAPGYRESAESWAAVLRDLKARDLGVPNLLVGDGHLGIWAAARQVWPEAAEQRCWNHKMVNVLDRLPKREQKEAREMLRKIAYAESRAGAEKAREAFAGRYAASHPKAVETLADDWERLVSFFDFPRQHWRHLRTTNVVESPFAAVRLRTNAAKRFRRVEGATALIWKLLMVAEKRFRKLNAPQLLPGVRRGERYVAGEPAPESAPQAARPPSRVRGVPAAGPARSERHRPCPRTRPKTRIRAAPRAVPCPGKEPSHTSETAGSGPGRSPWSDPEAKTSRESAP